MAKLPPQPLGVAPGSSYWNDWYEKLRTFVDQITTSVDWSIIVGKPTTLVGYGITDVTGTSNPSALVGTTAVNGVATTVMRSDAAPAINQAIAPTWASTHTYNANIIGGGSFLFGLNTTTPSVGGTGGLAGAHIQNYRATGNAAILQVAEAANAIYAGQDYSATAAQATIFRGTRFRGTQATPTAALSGDLSAAFQGLSFEGTASRVVNQIIFNIDTVTGVNDTSGYMSFSTRPDGAAAPLVENMRIDKNGNQVMGAQVALTTTATNGFTHLPTCAGIPTGVPVGYTGKVAMVYDTTNNRLYAYNGAWKFSQFI